MFISLALDGGECSASCPGHFNPQGKSPQYPFERRLEGPRTALDAVAKRKNPGSHLAHNSVTTLKPLRRYSIG
jgi:hypothetical protein